MSALRRARRTLIACLFSLLMLPGSTALADQSAAADVTSQEVPTRQVVSGHLVPALSGSKPVGPLDPNRSLALSIGLPARNTAQLQALLAAQSDPHSPQYRRYLTPAQFAAQFGADQATVDAVTGFLLAQGIQVEDVSSNRLLIHARSSADMVQRAFQVQLAEFDVAGARVHAPLNEPSVPRSLAGMVQGVFGLDNVPRFHPHLVRPSGPSVAGSGPGGGYTPGELRTAYDITPLENVADGTGQTIGLVEFATYTPGDITQFLSQYGLPTPRFVNIPIDGGVSMLDDGAVEMELDMEVAAGIAPGATQNLYMAPNSLNGELDLFNKIAADDAKVVSSSWGNCEQLSLDSERAAMNTILNQMAAQGQAFFVAAGDAGAYDCQGQVAGDPLSVDFPSSHPGSISVGGTTLLTGAGGSYSSESIWSCPTCSSGLHGAGGGGGLSVFYSGPAYQAGPGVLNAFSNGMREVPDVSADADPNTGYSIYCSVPVPVCFSGWTSIGGTSAAAPLWAGIAAEIDQYLAGRGKPTLGSGYATIYQLFNTAQPLAAYHDITVGSNLYYPATSGYDLASGIGSPDAWNLARDAAGGGVLAPTTMAAACVPATDSVGAATACTATVTDTSGSPQSPVGTVTWSTNDSGSFNPTTCNLATQTSSISSCQVTYTPSAVGSGSHTLTAAYGGDGAHAPSSGPFALAVQNSISCTPRPNIQVNVARIAPGQLGVSVVATGTGIALRSIQFGSSSNALIDIGTTVGSSGNFTMTLPTPVQQVSFVIRQSNPGLGATAFFTAFDQCPTPWQSFAGGGVKAFQ